MDDFHSTTTLITLINNITPLITSPIIKFLTVVGTGINIFYIIKKYKFKHQKTFYLYKI